MVQILIVDDDPAVCRLLRSTLAQKGHDVREAHGVTEARKALATGAFKVVFTDQDMPDGSGLDVMALCLETDASMAVVFLTGIATVELAVDAMRAGAFDFLPKPFRAANVLAIVERAIARADLFRENERLRSQVRRLSGPGQIVGRSPAIQKLRELIARVAPTDATALIFGETGSGKELAARAIHDISPRAQRPFLPVNCAGFGETLLESELFGHERGAFTGADRAREGLFEAAHHGTLFLDEAGEMSLSLQARLLRVLVTGELLRVGSTVPRLVDVRIVAATHRDLEQRVREGLFREDLYYRLAVVPIRVPPLRERKEDLPLLVEEILRMVAREMKVPPKALAPAASAKLASYDFPGNVRELRNLLERALILARGATIQPDDLPLRDEAGRTSMPSNAGRVEDWIAELPESLDLRSVLCDVERAIVDKALLASGGVAAQAARHLGVSRSDLGYKLRRLGLAGKG